MDAMTAQASRSNKTRALFRRAALVGAAIASLGFGVSASGAIVVASSGPSASKQYPVGKKVDENDRITLQPGDTVTVLAKRGTREFKGPGRFRVALPGAAPRNSAFAVFSRSRVIASRSTLGGTRNAEGSDLSPNLWYVDLDRPGTYCLANPAEITFWRAQQDVPARYTLAGPATAQTLAFAKGASIIATDTPVDAGETYTVYREGEDAPVGTANFVMLENAPGDAEGLAEALIAHGCTAQLGAMSNALAMKAF
jgi:hypothetical protein